MGVFRFAMAPSLPTQYTLPTTHPRPSIHAAGEWRHAVRQVKEKQWVLDGVVGSRLHLSFDALQHRTKKGKGVTRWRKGGEPRQPPRRWHMGHILSREQREPKKTPCRGGTGGMPMHRSLHVLQGGGEGKRRRRTHERASVPLRFFFFFFSFLLLLRMRKEGEGGRGPTTHSKQKWWWW